MVYAPGISPVLFYECPQITQKHPRAAGLGHPALANQTPSRQGCPSVLPSNDSWGEGGGVCTCMCVCGWRWNGAACETREHSSRCSWLNLATALRHATGQLPSTLAERGGSCLATATVELYRVRGGWGAVPMVVIVVEAAGGGGGH